MSLSEQNTWKYWKVSNVTFAFGKGKTLIQIQNMELTICSHGKYLMIVNFLAPGPRPFRQGHGADWQQRVEYLYVLAHKELGPVSKNRPYIAILMIMCHNS